jgi:hypothetical protein
VAGTVAGASAFFAWSVDDAAHDGDPQRIQEVVEGGGDLVGEAQDVDLCLVLVLPIA